MAKVEPKGNKNERDTFEEVSGHYDIAKEDLENRTPDFDKKDELFRSYINESKWPYRSLIFDPRVFTAIFEKTSRMFANKPRGRMVPREGGDALGAKICNELLSFQWDDNERVDGEAMLSKWARMDQNARKYGAGFGLVTWHYQRWVAKNGDDKGKPRTWYDGPEFKPWDNRDVLVNPSYSTIKNWAQLRSYPTLQELKDTNDAARSKPIYKNLDILRDAIKEEGSKKGGDQRESNYIVKNKAIKGLSDYLGQDEVYKTVELITEYRVDRWITFAPRYGVVVRDIPNPYNHGQIPIVLLKYYPIDDDIYGLSEIEPVEKLQRAINALVCQYTDAINMSLYSPLKIRSTGVQLHTIEFGMGKKWLMNDPATDVIPFDQTPTGVTEFTSTYRFMVGAMQEALGETSAATSNLVPGEQGKTATEVKDLALSRNARDNFNQIYLSEALKKQMLLWHSMNKQFLFNKQERNKVIRIVGKDAIQFFQKQGLDQEGITDQGMNYLEDEGVSDIIRPEDFMEPLFPIETEGGVMTKMSVESDNQSAKLYLEPEDLSGTYDYIPDVESMQIPDTNQLIAASKQLVELALNPQTTQLLAMDGYRIKTKELLEDYFERLSIKDADKYFEKQQQNPMMQGGINGQAQAIQPNAPGAGGVPPMPAGAGGMPIQGMA